MDPTPLSSLLVRDRVVSFREMDGAVQRMREAGGRLSTALFETTDLDTDIALERVRELSGYQAADDAVIESLDPLVVRTWSLSRVQRLEAIPFRRRDGFLDVLVLEGLSTREVDALREEGVAIRQFSVLEFRFVELLNRYFGTPVDGRYQRLSARWPIDLPEAPLVDAVAEDEAARIAADFIRDELDEHPVTTTTAKTAAVVLEDEADGGEGDTEEELPPVEEYTNVSGTDPAAVAEIVAVDLSGAHVEAEEASGTDEVSQGAATEGGDGTVTGAAPIIDTGAPEAVAEVRFSGDFAAVGDDSGPFTREVDTLGDDAAWADDAAVESGRTPILTTDETPVSGVVSVDDPALGEDRQGSRRRTIGLYTGSHAALDGDPDEWTLDQLTRFMKDARGRDEVLQAALSFCGRVFQRRFMLMLSGGQLRGLVGQDTSGQVSMDESSIYVMRSAFEGLLVSGEGFFHGDPIHLGLHHFYESIGQSVPEESVVIPVPIGGRPGVFLLGDGDAGSVDPRELPTIFVLVNRLVTALEGLIVRRRMERNAPASRLPPAEECDEGAAGGDTGSGEIEFTIESESGPFSIEPGAFDDAAAAHEDRIAARDEIAEGSNESADAVDAEPAERGSPADAGEPPSQDARVRRTPEADEIVQQIHDDSGWYNLKTSQSLADAWESTIKSATAVAPEAGENDTDRDKTDPDSPVGETRLTADLEAEGAREATAEGSGADSGADAVAETRVDDDELALSSADFQSIVDDAFDEVAAGATAGSRTETGQAPADDALPSMSTRRSDLTFSDEIRAVVSSLHAEHGEIRSQTLAFSTNEAFGAQESESRESVDNMGAAEEVEPEYLSSAELERISNTQKTRVRRISDPTGHDSLRKGRDLSRSFRHLSGDDPDAVADATTTIRAHGVAAYPYILDHFPGRLLVDRSKPDEEARHVREHGPLVALCYNQVTEMVDPLYEALASSFPQNRYYASRLLAYIRDLPLRPALFSALFDLDNGVRRLAMQILDNNRKSDGFDAFIARLRDRLANQNPEVAEKAILAVTKLRDLSAIPPLMQLVADGSATIARRASEALERLCFQVFGDDVEAWRTWYEANRNTPRSTWLAYAMVDERQHVRELAHRELQRTPRLVVNYHPEMSSARLIAARRTVKRFFESVD